MTEGLGTLGAAHRGDRRRGDQRQPAGALLIDITYRLRATQDVHNLVYPFYLERMP